jgi:hypothetical protein
MGNHGEIFKLLDGSYWQVQYEYEYLYEYYPNVIVCPSSGKMSVNGKSLSISRISASPAASRGAPTRALAVEFAKVEAVHPGWTKTMGTADFKTWLAKQPASVRKLEQSDRSDDAILLLDLYKRDADNRGNGVARGQIR